MDPMRTLPIADSCERSDMLRYRDHDAVHWQRFRPSNVRFNLLFWPFGIRVSVAFMRNFQRLGIQTMVCRHNVTVSYSHCGSPTSTPVTTHLNPLPVIVIHTKRIRFCSPREQARGTQTVMFSETADPTRGGIRSKPYCVDVPSALPTGASKANRGDAHSHPEVVSSPHGYPPTLMPNADFERGVKLLPLSAVLPLQSTEKTLRFC